MKPLFIFLFLAFSFNGYSQNVIRWSFNAKKIADKTYELYITATINEGWHVYSQTTPKDGPSLPTTITFNKNPLIGFKGKVKEVGKMVTRHEEILDVDLKYYKEKVDFVQVVTLKANVKTQVSGTVEFMACTDKRCLLPEKKNFSIVLNAQ